MNLRLVSVIIPAYNNAEYLGDAIESVLQQTHRNLELIIVNDASLDGVAAVVNSYNDARMRYIVHEHNKGLSAARNTGIQSAKGEYIALLDGDDFFHVDKLRLHVEFLEKNPEVGATYNARFDLTPSAKTINKIWRPPLKVGLKELLSGFPFGPSDMVIRRKLVLNISMFDEYYVYVGEDLDFNCRLALAGCKFASVDRVLNYRRYYSGRIIKNIPYFVDNTFRAMITTFADPRCPEAVISIRDEAFANHYILWSAIAFAQSDFELGREYCRSAVRLNPTLLNGQPPKIVEIFVNHCIFDSGRDHEELLRRLFRELPDELQLIAKREENWAVTYGFLLKGIQAIMWNRLEDGKALFTQAITRRAKLSGHLLIRLAADLISYEKEYGLNATLNIIQNLTPFLEKLENSTNIRWSKGFYYANYAFAAFNEGNYRNVPSRILKAVAYEPAYTKNRGMIKMFLLSLLRQLNKNFSQN